MELDDSDAAIDFEELMDAVADGNEDGPPLEGTASDSEDDSDDEPVRAPQTEACGSGGGQITSAPTPSTQSSDTIRMGHVAAGVFRQGRAYSPAGTLS